MCLMLRNLILKQSYSWACERNIGDFYYAIDHNVVKKSTPDEVPVFVKEIIVDYCDRVEIADGEYQHVKLG